MPRRPKRWNQVTRNVLFALGKRDQQNRRAVLFVHGFTGNHADTWINARNGASFPHLIHQDNKLADYDVFSFQYNTSAVSGTSIKSIARQLADEINGGMKRYEQIVIIAHSMGGLVSMRYILDQLAAGKDLRIRGLLLYCVPITGSYLVTMAKAARVVLQFAVPKGSTVASLIGLNKQIKQMDSASEFVQELNDEWSLRVVNGGHSSEDAKRRTLLPVRVVTGTKDLVVKEVSAKGTYGSIDWHPIDHGHAKLVKPSGHNDVRYKNAREFLVGCKPVLDRTALFRLREISDSLLDARHERLARHWDYRVSIHGGANYDDGDKMLVGGFSPFVIKRCKYQVLLPSDEVTIGVAWGNIAANEAWEHDPFYVHHMFTREMSKSEKSKLSKVVDDMLELDTAEQSWDAFFPSLDATILHRNNKHELVPGSIERSENLLLRKHKVPNDAKLAINEEVVIDIQFKSYVPRNTKTFTLMFPWLHVRFNGLISVHEKCTKFVTSQFLSGEEELKLDEEHADHRSQLKLKTDDIVLPNSRVEINW